MKYFYAEVITESSDRYRFLFKEEPDREDLAQRVWEWESGEEEDLEDYLDQCSVIIQELELE